MESRFQAQVMKYIKSRGGEVFNVHGHPMQRRGVPDLWVCLNGVQVWLELKWERGTYKTIQLITMEKFRKAGALAYGLRSIGGEFWLEEGENVILRCKTLDELFESEPIRVQV